MALHRNADGSRISRGAAARAQKAQRERAIHWIEWKKPEANGPAVPIRHTTVGLPPHHFPPSVVKSLRRQQQRRRDKRWDGLAIKPAVKQAA